MGTAEDCVWCERPLCEHFVTRVLMTGDGDTHCPESQDGRHHTELPGGARRGFIVRMARIAEEEPPEFREGDDLVTRTLDYAGSARPRVTRDEVERVLGGTCMDHSECVPAGKGNSRGHVHEGETGMWIWPVEVGKGLYEDSPTGA
jgi:hypothetical protein